MPSLYEALGLSEGSTAPEYFVLGWDVVGGVFALDGGALRGVKGHVCYYAPDALQWEDLDFGHAEFVRWTLTGGLATLAADLRWEGWETEAPEIPLDEVFLSDPPLVDDRRPGGRRGGAPPGTGRRASRAPRGGRCGDVPAGPYRSGLTA